MQEISMHDIEREYAPGEGRHWFDKDTMRFFRTRLPLSGWRGAGGTYFTSSEKPYRHGRRYSVRRLVGPGCIDTVGDFCGYATAAQARSVAKRLAKGGK